MFKKIKVLAAMVDLGLFTVAELASACDVSEATVRTVVHRCPSGWLESETVPSGARGGQPSRYRLTETGAERIREQLTELRADSPLDALARPGDSPLGLQSAKKTLKQLKTVDLDSSADDESVQEWRRDALDNLAWAAAELEDQASFPNAVALRIDVESLRREIGQLALVQRSAGLPEWQAMAQKYQRFERATAPSVEPGAGNLLTNILGQFFRQPKPAFA